MCGQDLEKQKRLSVIGEGRRQGFLVGFMCGTFTIVFALILLTNIGR